LTAPRPPLRSTHPGLVPEQASQQTDMESPTTTQNFVDSTFASVTSNLDLYSDPDRHSQLSDQNYQAQSEGSSTSGASIRSYGGHGMYRGNGGFPRGTRGRGHRTYSGSSGSSSGRNSHPRPILRSTSVPEGRITPPVDASHPPARVDSPTTPIKQQSSFTMNGHTISETYTLSGGSATTPPRLYSSPIPTRRNYGGSTPGCQQVSQRPITGNDMMHWTDHQEHKIKVLGLPKTCWTKEVCTAMSRYGNVVRVEIEQGSRNHNAWVTFQ
jgi:RNA-dependent RNA polymerase